MNLKKLLDNVALFVVGTAILVVAVLLCAFIFHFFPLFLGCCAFMLVCWSIERVMNR